MHKLHLREGKEGKKKSFPTTFSRVTIELACKAHGDWCRETIFKIFFRIDVE